jgi:hypothetical protein
MWNARKTACFACSIAFSTVSAVPGFTQSNSAPPTDTVPFLLSVGTAPVVRVYDSRAADGDAVLPPNLTYSLVYRDLLHSMLRKSATFRRQCQRLAHAEAVTVTLRTASTSAPITARAQTNIVRVQGGLRATVEIRALDDAAELVAHELEHVIEQIDGIDLKKQSLQPGKGVTECQDGSFETVRAVRVGRLVAQETRAGR